MNKRGKTILLSCIGILIIIAIANSMFGAQEANAVVEVIEEEFVVPDWCYLFFEESYDSELEAYESFLELTAQYEEYRKELYKGFDREKRLKADNEVKEQYLSAARELMSRWKFDIDGYDKDRDTERLLEHLKENVRLYGQTFFVLKQWETGELSFREYYKECSDIYSIYKVKGTYETFYFHMMEICCPELYTTDIDCWIKAIPDPTTNTDSWKNQSDKYRNLYLIGCDIESGLWHIPGSDSKREEIAEVKKVLHRAWSNAVDEVIAENEKIVKEKKQDDVQEKSQSSGSVKTYNVVKYGTRTRDSKYCYRGKCVTPGCIYYTSYGCGSYCEIHYDPKKYGKRGGTPRDWDIYGSHTYSDPEDFADDWEDDFDSWDDAYDYWEDYDE